MQLAVFQRARQRSSTATPAGGRDGRDGVTDLLQLVETHSSVLDAEGPIAGHVVLREEHQGAREQKEGRRQYDGPTARVKP
jgi:hypothetical protein